MQKPFSLATLYPSFKRFYYKPLVFCVDHLLGLARLDKAYSKITTDTPLGFMAKTASYFKLNFSIPATELAKVPTTGATIIVANHPTGLKETIVMYKVLSGIRSDIKFMATGMLCNIPELTDILIKTNPFETKKAKKENAIAIKKAMRHLKQNGLLVIFPAGEVSSLKLSEKRILDKNWNPFALTLAQKTNAQIVPFFFRAKNDWKFQVAGLIHPYLRTILLARAFLKQARQTMTITVAEPKTAKDVSGDVDFQTAFLQKLNRALALKDSLNLPEYHPTQRTLAPIANAISPAILVDEINALPKDAHLLTYKNFEAYLVKTPELNALINEIGRQREITYREIGEGSGLASDIDEFDQYYYQLILWDKAAGKLVGGYRIGLVQEIYEKYGKDALYLNAFYNNTDELFPKDGYMIEMGRSFVTSEYQRQFTPLLLVWQAIGQILLKFPKYRRIIGLISLSRDENTEFGLRFLTACMQYGKYKDTTAFAVKPTPKHPYSDYKQLPKEILDLAKMPLDFKQIAQVISEFDGKPPFINILLKHYCQQMGTKCFDFSIDKDFGDVIDILAFSDIHKCGEQHLKRYFGPEGLEQFFEIWGKPEQ